MLHLERVQPVQLAELLERYAAAGRDAYLSPNRLEEIYRPGTPKRSSVNGDRLPFRGPDVQWDRRTFALTNMCDRV